MLQQIVKLSTGHLYMNVQVWLSFVVILFIPFFRTYILTSSMDRKVCLVEICPGDVQIIKTFQDHKK